MKKLLLLIIALLASIPYGMGWFVENRYNAIISNLNAHYGISTRFTGNFQRSYLSSNAKTEITILSTKEQIDINHKIKHGPVIFDFTSWLSASSYIPTGYMAAQFDTAIDSKFIKQLNMFYGAKQALSIITKLSFTGNSITIVSNPALSLPVFVGSLNWNGFTANIAIDNAFSNINVAFMAPQLSYKENPKTLTKEINVTGVSFNIRKILASAKLEGDFSVEKASLKTNGVDDVNISNITIGMKEETLDKLINLQTDYHFDTLKIATENYGPLNLTMKFANINIAAIEKQPPADSQPFLINGTNMNISTDQALQFFAELPSLDLTLNFDTPNGKMNVVSNIIAGGKDLAKADQQSILDTVKANATVHMDKILVYSLLSEQIEQQIEDNEKAFYLKHKNATKNPYTLTPDEMQKVVETLIIGFFDKLQKDNLIVEKDNTVSADIKYEKNTFNINGIDRNTDDLNKLSSMLDYKAADTSLPDDAATTTTTTTTTEETSKTQ